MKSKIMTFAPSAMKVFAVARPIPDPPPVIECDLVLELHYQSNL